MSITTEITRLQTAKSDLKTAIEAKGVTVPSATTIDGYATLVGQIQTGGGPSGPVERKDVNFYDYEGTVLYSYTKSEFLALESMPSNPSHTGLTARGWNWTLANAKTYVTDNGKLEIGQMYYAASGKTELYITISPGLLKFGFDFNQGTANGVSIDWGDGNTETTGGTGRRTLYHTYSEAGDYVMKIGVTTGTFSFRGACIMYDRSALRKLVMARGVSGMAQSAFANQYALEEVILGDGTIIPRYAFQYDRSLKHITIPNTYTSFDNDQEFCGCMALRTVSLPKEISTWGINIFGDCHSLLAITIPPVSQNIPFKLCYNCHCLKEVTIPKEATGINGSVFQNCWSLTEIKIPANIASINIYAFQTCSSLHTLDLSPLQGKAVVLYNDCFRAIPATKVILPTDATLNAGFQFAEGIGAFGMNNYDSAMSGIADFVVNLPNITTIGQAAFYYSFVTEVRSLGTITSLPNSNNNRGVFSNCYFLKSATLPSTLTSIGDRVFYGCSTMETLTILATTPPTLANTNAIPNNLTAIYVPTESVTAYQEASGWSSFASKIQALEE